MHVHVVKLHMYYFVFLDISQLVQNAVKQLEDAIANGNYGLSHH